VKLGTRLIATALLVSIPVAVVLYEINESLRARDMTLALQRFVASQMTDDFRERCESNPNWFIAGPREDRPAPEVLAAPDADVTAPRPPRQELPVEYFAYDDAYMPLSSSGPRFPNELRQALRSGSRMMTEPFVTPAGSGVQEALLTGWVKSPCVALLFRMRPIPHQALERAAIFFGLSLAIVSVALLVGGPLVLRLRRLGLEARQSAASQYRSPIDGGGRDEVSALAFAFNEAATDIRRRATDVKDREDSLRRYVTSSTEDIASPLEGMEQRLADTDGRTDLPLAPPDRRAALIEVHSLAMRARNLAAAATLRMSIESPARDVVDLGAAVDRVTRRQMGFARASEVGLAASVAAPGVHVMAHAALIEQALANLVDNAIRYNRAGGQVAVALDRTQDGRFSLRVSDDGPGVADDVLARLNANRRFRGDEGRSREPGQLGLGLAIVREVADRFGIKWAFRRSAKGWFEAELTGPTK
jgi:signal transduction histidine kinase